MFGFLSNNLFTGHRAADTTGLSPRLWGRLTGSMMASDGSKRLVLVGDDFLCMNHLATTYANINSEQAYTAYIDSGSTFTVLADEKGGVLALTGDATDNDEIWIEAGDGTGQLGQISDTAADAHLTVFECRVKFDSLVDGVCSFFAGLAKPGTAAVEALVDNTGAIKATTQFLGFRNLLDGDNIQCIYQAVADSAAVINMAHVHDAAGDTYALVADTFVKLGFVYDPDAVAAKRITWYVDNVEQSTYVTATQIATATFPDAEALTFLFGYKNTVGTTPASTEGAIDWWGFGSLI